MCIFVSVCACAIFFNARHRIDRWPLAVTVQTNTHTCETCKNADIYAYLHQQQQRKQLFLLDFDLNRITTRCTTTNDNDQTQLQHLKNTALVFCVFLYFVDLYLDNIHNVYHRKNDVAFTRVSRRDAKRSDSGLLCVTNITTRCACR